MIIKIIFIIVVIVLFMMLADAMDMTDETFNETFEIIGISLLIWVSFSSGNKNNGYG